ncbi:hypothetical protein LSH36_1682g00000 [Paralvinella palmiformis]|uniref:Ig-like domain-containing protein n=1 Tax=Paralvinella palmiformis TaxID=53620 RepID=A0AAD9ISM5_9ANNE|nr:hypothetical protein LSH36_1682g00000 [Paralvinella palmiformis]
MIKSYPGENITVTWRIGDIRTSYIRHIEIEHSVNYIKRTIISCYRIEECVDESSERHIGVITTPRVNLSAPFNSYITDIGFFVIGLNPSDAGSYEFHFDYRYMVEWIHARILYVYQRPTKPVISSIIKVKEVILTCSSKSQSLPEEYRNNSLLEYTWIVDDVLDNYDIDDDRIRIISPGKVNSGKLFSCKAKEVNSKLMSETSVKFLLDSPYLENIQVTLSTLEEAPEMIFLTCVAECKPACTYKWLDDVGRIIASEKNVTHQNGNNIDIVTCHATNLLGTLTQRINLQRLIMRNGYRRSVVISLSVLLVLSLGVSVVGGVMFMLYKRRRTQDTRNDITSSGVIKEMNEPVYVNHTVKTESSHTADSTYDQLGSSRDPPLEPSTYDNLSLNVSETATNQDNEATYEL